MQERYYFKVHSAERVEAASSTTAATATTAAAAPSPAASNAATRIQQHNQTLRHSPMGSSVAEPGLQLLLEFLNPVNIQASLRLRPC